MLGITFDLENPEKIDFWLRLLDTLSESYSETLEPYRVDLNLERQRPLCEYQLELNPKDKAAINHLVTVFELLCGKVTAAPLK